MSDSLVTYLHDHLAGAAFAIDLLESLRDHYAGQPLGELASSVLLEVKQDREVLQGFANRIGKGSSGVKEAAGWVAEKVMRMKLTHSDAMGLGTFQALETLALGILGKLALWEALKVIAESDDRLSGIDLEHLSARALEQHAQVEASRLLVARSAFPRA